MATLAPLKPYRFGFYTIGHNDIAVPLPQGPFTRNELKDEIHKYSNIIYEKFKHRKSINDNEALCRSSDSIDERYLSGRVISEDIVIYYYNQTLEGIRAKNKKNEWMESYLGGVLTIKVMRDPEFGIVLRGMAACVPEKNKGIGGEFISIFKDIAKINNITKITLECYGEELRKLYTRKGFKVVSSKKESPNSNNESPETMYQMEAIIPPNAWSPSAPHPSMPVPLPRELPRTRPLGPHGLLGPLRPIENVKLVGPAFGHYYSMYSSRRNGTRKSGSRSGSPRSPRSARSARISRSLRTPRSPRSPRTPKN